MLLIKQLFYFLGSIYCAIPLIGLTALLVLTATWIESWADSHLFAIKWVYHNPAFLFLLICFFINILFSALRRYPYKLSHIPFLMTHLGLLMIIGGIAIKNQWGIQGNMIVHEGCSTNQVIIPGTQAVILETRNRHEKPFTFSFPLYRKWNGEIHIADNPTSPYKVQINSYAPHCMVRHRHWSVLGNGRIQGVRSFPLEPSVKEEKKIDNPRLIHWNSLQDPPPTAVYGIQSVTLEEGIQIALSSIEFQFEPVNSSDEKSIQICLKDILKGSSHFKATLSVEVDSQGFLSKASIDLGLNNAHNVHIDCLDKATLFSPLLTQENRSWKVSCNNPQKLFIIEDQSRNICLALIESTGQIQTQFFFQGKIEDVVSLDQGYAGYFVKATFEPTMWPLERDEWNDIQHFIIQALIHRDLDNLKKSFPWSLLKESCENHNVHFPTIMAKWIAHMENNPYEKPSLTLCQSVLGINFSSLDAYKPIKHPLDQDNIYSEASQFKALLNEYQESFERYSLKKATKQQISDAIKLYRGCHLFQLYADNYFKRESVKVPPYLQLLISPLLDLLGKQHTEDAYFIALEFIRYALKNEKEPFLSWLQWMRMHQDWNNTEYWQSLGVSPVELYAPLELEFQILNPPTKIEDREAFISLNLYRSEKKQYIAMSFDKTATGLKWPIREENILARFQPQTISLPWKVHLKDARHFAYPGSTKPFSFECDLCFIPLEGASSSNRKKTYVTLSMNHVYETDNGYRFFLSNISPLEEKEVQRIQLVVNYDPAKWYLTYPGSLLVCIGCASLFYQQLKKNKYKKQAYIEVNRG